MYALVDDRGKQYRMAPGDVIVMDRLNSEVGSEVRFERVLLVRDDSSVNTGTPFIEGVAVVAEHTGNFLGEKIVIGKFKRRKKYRRKTGHRQPLSRVRVKEIIV